MKKLFILGAGFSKAISSEMPLLSDLSKYIKTIIADLPGDKQIYSKLCDDPESFLTYLSQPLPWKYPETINIDRASFIILSRNIAQYIKLCEYKSLQSHIFPEWAIKLINYYHDNNTTIVTLNYDTIIERLLSKIKIENDNKITLEEIYPLPIIPLHKRTGKAFTGKTEVSSLKLLKLHGSVNWLYPGEEDIFSQQIYFENYQTEFSVAIPSHYKNKIDLVPLIIPPVADKSSFYKLNIIKSMWNLLNGAIEWANEIYCIGYSLPKTDLTMSLYLSSRDVKNKIVYIVNNIAQDKKEELLQRYRDIFNNYAIDQRYLKENCIESMVNDITNETKENKNGSVN